MTPPMSSPEAFGGVERVITHLDRTKVVIWVIILIGVVSVTAIMAFLFYKLVKRKNSQSLKWAVDLIDCLRCKLDWRGGSDSGSAEGSHLSRREMEDAASDIEVAASSGTDVTGGAKKLWAHKGGGASFKRYTGKGKEVVIDID